MPRPRSLTFLTIAFFACSSALQAEQVRVAGTDILLAMPDGFTPMERYPGYQNAETGASVLVTEIPGPIHQVTAGFTEELLATRGMTLIDSEPFPVAGTAGRLISVSQAAQEVEWLKWFVAFGDNQQSVLVVATYPKSAAEGVGEELRAVVLSAERASHNAGEEEGLLFSLEETDNLTIIHRVGNMLMLAPPGSEIPIDSSQPTLIVGSSIGSVPLADLASFAERRARQIEQVRDLSQIQGRELTVDGRPAYELTARASDYKTGEAMAVYELIISEGGHYHVAIGLVTADRFDDHLAAFREVAESLRLRI